MTTRTAELSAFLATLHLAIAERAKSDTESFRVIKKIMQSLEVEQPAAPKTPVWLPVCDLLDNAVQEVSASALSQNANQPVSIPASLVDHAQALSALAPQLVWWRRPNTEHMGKSFADGHANAMVIGGRGLEEHDGISIGISLMAPGIEYPEHHHSPEEVYLIMSRGYWNQAGGSWHEPGVGGLVYNPPDILHSMQSTESTLLATWCLLH